MKAKIIFLVLLWASVFAASVIAAGQTTSGIPPFASIGGGPFDHLDLANLKADFRAGQILDAQRYGASNDYANYAFGVYMSAAGYTLDQALTGADIYAQHRGHYGPNVPMDPKYKFTPEENVMNVTYGFKAQQMGTLCHTQVGSLRNRTSRVHA